MPIRVNVAKLVAYVCKIAINSLLRKESVAAGRRTNSGREKLADFVSFRGVAIWIH